MTGNREMRSWTLTGWKSSSFSLENMLAGMHIRFSILFVVGQLGDQIV